MVTGSRYCAPTLILLAFAASAWSQILSFGVKAGVPATDGFPANYVGAYERRYTIGPTAEVHLPLHLSFEVDVLYRREGLGASTITYRFGGPPRPPVLIVERARVNDWQVPFLLKWQVGSRPIRPFVDGGITYRHISGQTVSDLYDASDPSLGMTTTTAPASGSNANSVGITFGAGVSAKLLLLRISPELRGTHWFSPPLIGNYLGTRAIANQLDILVGLTF